MLQYQTFQKIKVQCEMNSKNIFELKDPLLKDYLNFLNKKKWFYLKKFHKKLKVN